MQIQVSVFICVHPWFKERKSKAPSKRQPDSIIIGVPLNPYNFLEKKEPRMNSDGHGLKPIAGIHSSPLAFLLLGVKDRTLSSLSLYLSTR